MRVLVTGHNGYIGAVLTPMLTQEGFDVVGLDSNWFEDCAFGPQPEPVAEIRKDYRDATVDDFRGFDAVLHLANLSNDPLGDLDAEHGGAEDAVELHHRRVGRRHHRLGADLCRAGR